MPATANEKLADAEVGHAVDRLKFSNGVVRRLIALLNRTDADLFGQITAALERLPPESFTVARLEQLLQSVRALNAQAYQAVTNELNSDLRDLATYETGYQQTLFETTIPAQIRAQVSIATVDAGQVYQAAMARPFQGRLLSEWSASIEADRMARIRDALRIGYVQGETTSQMVQRIRGTRANAYSDGIIEIDRRNAEAVVRTAISHVAANARDAFYEANDDIIEAVSWCSTLDSRTSEICQVRDGLQYTVDTHKPIGHSVPWLGGPGKAHWNCRSTSAPVVKSFKDLGIDFEDFSAETRASMDGEVPADQTYGEWLTKQSAARQDDVLGPTRGKLLRTGGLTIDKFSNDKGQWLTLDQLRERDEAAFERAGV